MAKVATLERKRATYLKETRDLYQALYFCGQGSCLGTCDWDCC